MNLLQALPKTPLWDRLAKADRLVDDPNLESNVRFLRPHDEVLASWRRAIAHCYEPARVFARYRHQIEATYANRIKTPARAKLKWHNIRRGLILSFNLTLRVGISPIIAASSGPRCAMRSRVGAWKIFSGHDLCRRTT